MAITKATASSIAPAAKGDLVVGSATNDAGVLAVGTDTHILVADSAESLGMKWAAPAGASLVGVSTKGNNPSLTQNVRTVLAFTTEEFDTDGFHDNSTNNSRITIPAGKGGKYFFSFGGYWGNGTSRTIIRFLKNGSSIRDMQYFGSGTSEFGATIFAYLDLVATDYIEVDAITTGATLTFWTSAQCGFNAIYLGA
jgi:hypothetical protein